MIATARANWIAMTVLALVAPALADAGQPPKAKATPIPAAHGQGAVKNQVFHSHALGVDKHYEIYLPGGYDQSSGRYPVIYLLHGLGGDETNWVDYGGLAKTADAMRLPTIVVMPDGDDSWYVNRATPTPDYESCLAGKREFGFARDMHTYCVKTASYEDYIVKDLVSHVDATYRTLPERRARAIGGQSMGGYGALALGLRHRDLFAAIFSHSGVDSLFYKGPHPYDAAKVQIADNALVPAHWGENTGPIGALVRTIFGPDLANWEAHDPATLAAKLHDGDIALYLDVGTEDDFGLDAQAHYLDSVLTKAGVQHTFFAGPGRHNFAFWKDRLDDSLAFCVATFKQGGLSPTTVRSGR
jgi:S-formylglutathione hydrolase FrmB